MLTLLTIFGGVALLLFGVRFLRKGLDRLFGPRLGPWMSRIGARRGLSFVSGFGLSVLAPSSTTISILATQTVQAGHMTARQMLAVMFGADIGLTVLVQFIAFRMDEYAPIAILLGMVLFQFTERQHSRGVGQVLLGFGFIFMAIGIIRDAVAGGNLTASADFVELMAIAGRYPWVLAVLAGILTMLLQSSTATIGLVIGLAAAGAAPMRIAIPAVVGANVGLAATMLVIGFSHVESRRLAVGNLLVKGLVGVVAIIVLIAVGSRLPESSPGRTAFWIAQFHTSFNIVVAIVGLPAVVPLTALLRRMIPESTGPSEQPFGPRYIEHGPAGGVTLALGQSMREIMRVAEIVRGMLDDVWTALRTNNEELARSVGDRDDQVDLLDREIKRFLTRLVTEDTHHINAREQMRQLRYLNELETIGDTIDKNLSELVLKKIRIGATFTNDGSDELDGFYHKVAQNLLIADTAFATRDRALARKLLRHKERINRHEEELRDRHFSRLTTGLSEALETSAIHLDLLTHLKRINSCVTHVAYATLEEAEETATDRGVQPGD